MNKKELAEIKGKVDKLEADIKKLKKPKRKCELCNKHQEDVRYLIESIVTFKSICDECIDLSAIILAENRLEKTS